jgi:hypothetical protein
VAANSKTVKIAMWRSWAGGPLKTKNDPLNYTKAHEAKRKEFLVRVISCGLVDRLLLNSKEPAFQEAIRIHAD